MEEHVNVLEDTMETLFVVFAILAFSLCMPIHDEELAAPIVIVSVQSISHI